jgi:predicted RNase H-like HicB family nuclease
MTGKEQIKVKHTRSYLAIIERAADGSYSAYVPDLPGCVAIGQDTPEAAKRLIGQAIKSHVAGLIEDGLPVLEPASQAEIVEAVA